MCVRHKWAAGQRWCWNWRLQAWAEQEAFQKGFNTKVLKKSRLNKPLLLPQLGFQDASVTSDIHQFSQICLPSCSSCSVCTWGRRAEDRSCSAQVRLFAIQSRRASLGLTYRSKWKWFLPLGCSPWPSTHWRNLFLLSWLIYYLWNIHDFKFQLRLFWLPGFVYVQGQMNSLHPTVGSFLKKHISPLFLQEKTHENHGLGCSRSFHPL